MPQCLPAHGRADANPARAVRVVLALAVPVELHLHAAVFVGEDLLARGPDDHAVCGPCTTGLAVLCARGRNGSATGMHVKVFS